MSGTKMPFKCCAGSGNNILPGFAGEIFYTLEEARVVIESWRRHYNTVRPHSLLGNLDQLRPATPTVVPRPIMN